MLRILVVLILVLLVSATVAGRAEDWPQFRGLGGQRQAVGASWPLRWSEQENIAWKVPISGRGWSSPVVSDQQIWLTTALETAATVEVTKRTLERKGKDVPSPQVASHLTLKAICVDRASGRVLHDVTLFEIDEPEVISSSNSFASPTPVVDRGRVFCEFGALGTACADAATGTVIWSRRLVVDHQVPKQSSPLLVGEELYLVADTGVASCLDASSGASHWSQRLPGTVLASPVATDGRIYFFGEAGTTTVVRPGKQFEQLAENHLDGRVLASPALVDQAIILRIATHLYKIRSPAK